MAYAKAPDAETAIKKAIEDVVINDEHNQWQLFRAAASLLGPLNAEQKKAQSLLQKPERGCQVRGAR